MLLTGAAVTLALASGLSLASFNGLDVAAAAADRATSFLQLMSQRSPGERVKGDLTKTKHRHFRVLAEHIPAAAVPEIPVPPLTGTLVDVIAPPVELLPGGIELPQLAELVPPKELPAGVTLLPPGGGIVPCCAAGPQPPSAPPPPPPPPPPAVPEPDTWMTIIAGFGVIGWFLRRGQRRSGTGVNTALDARGLSAGQ